MMKDIFPYRGSAYMILRYASMRRRRPFMPEDVLNVFNHKFKKPSDINRPLDRLHQRGFVKQESDGWLITEQGYNYLRLTARTYNEERVSPSVNA